ncbi:Dynein regulatory complex subunit 2 [Coelomomyces lativittatus]|nr:Dynein regulatory complex subunit 2 [Coelomomyces lativittatus]
MAKKKSENAGKTEADLIKNEEQRKKFLEAQMTRRKENFEKENRISSLNQFKIRAQWKEILKKAKCEALTEQLNVLNQVHNRQVDLKNYIILSLQQTLEETDQQYDTAYQAHLQNINDLLELQYNRLDALETDFEIRCKDLEMEFGAERAKLHSMHLKEKSDLLGVIYRMDQDFLENEADARHDYQSNRDDVKNKNLEEKHALRIQLEGTIEDLWRQFQTALANYNATTEERKRQFEELKAKDEQAAQTIEQQLKKISKLSEMIAGLKQKLTAIGKESDWKLMQLKANKEKVVHDFQILKRKMNGYREEEKKKLIELTSLTIKASKQLEERVQLAEKILKLSEMNNKLATQEEKVLWAMEQEKEEKDEDFQFDILETTSENEESDQKNDVLKEDLNNAQNEKKMLRKLQRRMNKIMLDKLALETKKEKLTKENEALEILLKTYIDGISVNNEVIDTKNTLFVVNGKTNIILYEFFFFFLLNFFLNSE